MKSISIYMGRMHTQLEKYYSSNVVEREVVPVSWVGQGITWKFLKPMKEVSNPGSSEIRYSDDYLARLNRLYPLAGSECDFPKTGRAKNLFRCTFESPFERTIPECLLGDILRSSASAGEWQPSIINPHYIKDEFLRTSRNYLGRVEAYDPSKWGVRPVPQTFLSAVALAKHEGYVFTVSDGDMVALVPSQKAIEFFLERARQVRKGVKDSD